MAIEQVQPDKASFPKVVAFFVVTLLVIFVAATILLVMRNRKRNHPPYTQHPTSFLATPGNQLAQG